MNPAPLSSAGDTPGLDRALVTALLEKVPDLIYFKDRESRFLAVSASLARRSGFERAEDMVGKCDLDFYGEATARRTRHDEEEIIATGIPILGKMSQQTWQDGHVTWTLTNKFPLRDLAGEIIGTFGVTKDITKDRETEAELERIRMDLITASRRAGMAEVATEVLHNIGNVLNSVNVSATLVADTARHSKAANLGKLAALLAEHSTDLGAFLTGDPRGKMVQPYLTTLAEELGRDQKAMVSELDQLGKNIDHIKDIVAMQQSYAKTSGFTETISITDLLEDALRMNAGSLARHDVDIVRDYQVRPVMTLDKHKVLQILINLIRNAKYACDEAGRIDKRLTLRLTTDERTVQIAVADNGVGIPPENLTRIFNHGFTTRATGHGFGLHSGALAAKEMGGSLLAHSEGPGRGATFVLTLPFKPETPAHGNPIL